MPVHVAAALVALVLVLVAVHVATALVALVVRVAAPRGHVAVVVRVADAEQAHEVLGEVDKKYLCLHEGSRKRSENA